ncbi:DUF4190 domain-containing protein [Streptomyces sp. P9(2023)]|uniref:DUF4190 domain-containing protein n=1 Tax=Streptomyces sp. P9(2023) TaxID=3064394 RepID=UPI0028F3FF36|nr:DUF4190 domain-containing protein [Streptomyces sp. P9(2023)]MDT9688391.1 DUF4190 domain-containing protein [Streptomyces sp. P9(2023)]
MEPSQPPQESQPAHQGWPAPEPSNPTGPPAAPAAAPGPYTSAPYGPYGPVPYGIPPQRTTNGMAIASLVSGIVCCLPPLGLIFGLVALPQIRKRNQTGKGLAIAGIVLSSLSCLLITVGLVSGVLGEAWGGFKRGMDEAARSSSAFSLRTGQCYNVDGDVEAETAEVEVVDCELPHEGEVTGGFELTGFSGWPGENAIDDAAAERCADFGSAYALDSWAFPEEVVDFYYMPSRSSWRAGDRAVTCAFIVDGGDPMKGSLRADKTTLDADQLHFLTTMNPIDDVLNEEPEADVDEDLAANKAWAGKVHGALTTASRGLRTHSWPAAATTDVADLVKELDASAKQWDKLAKAADADAFWEHYDAAYDGTYWDSESKARATLRLAATSSEPDTSA